MSHDTLLVVEPHVLCCVAILACTVGCDALTALDPQSEHVDAPSSLRVSSLVLVAILASPVLKGVNLVDQRVFVGLVLAVFSFWGLHEASEDTRSGDCLFVAVTTLAVIYIMHQGGIETERVRPDSQRDKPHRRQSMTALCGALFFYSGLRGLRAALVSSSAASEYKVEYQSLNGATTTSGYAVSFTDTTFPLGFAHGVCVGIGALISLHDEARIVGSSAIAYEVGASGIAVLVAANWAFIGTATQMEALLVLYGPGACKGDMSVCYESARARRFVFSNNNSASAWLAGLAALVFSFSIQTTCVETPLRGARTLRRQGVGFLLAALVVSVFAVFEYSRFEGVGYHTDIVLLVSMMAVFVSATSDTLAGSILYAAAMTYEQVYLLNAIGPSQVFVHLTHVTLFGSLALLWTWVACATVKELVECGFTIKEDSLINRALGTLATAGTSLTFGLFVASCLLLAASNGNLPQEDDVFRGGSPKRSMLQFVLAHFVPLFVWLPLYVRRCEVNLITECWRHAVWLAAMPLDAIVYVLILVALGESAPTAVMVHLSGVSATGVSAVTAWTLGAFV